MFNFWLHDFEETDNLSSANNGEKMARKTRPINFFVKKENICTILLLCDFVYVSFEIYGENMKIFSHMLTE